MSGRRPTSTPRSTTRRAPRGASRTATCTARSSSGSGPPRGPSAPCCRSTRPRSSPSTSPSTTSWCRARAPGRTRSSATSAPPTSATATTRSGTPGATASARWPAGCAPSRAVLDVIFRRWRQWDWIAAQRVDRYITNSRTTQARIRNYWNRDSVVVYPPVETSRFQPGEVGQHYMVLSELMPHKRIDVAIEAFNKLGLPLVVCGDGPEARALRRIAGPTIQFVGRVSDPEAARLLSSCARARGGRGRGVRHRRRGGPGRRPAGDRGARRRHARDGRGRRDRLLLVGRAQRARRGGGRLRRRRRGSGRPACATPPASTRPSSSASCRARWRAPSPSRTPQPRRPRPVLRTARLARRAGL